MIKQSKSVNKILSKISNFYITQNDSQQSQNQKQQKLSKDIYEKGDKRKQYLQDFENKLNEISIQNTKKYQTNKQKEKLQQIIEFGSDLSESAKILQSQLKRQQLKLKQGVVKTKRKICRQFFITNKCRNAEQCNFAHNINEIQGEYLPKIYKKQKVWIQYFQIQEQSQQKLDDQKSQINLLKGEFARTWSNKMALGSSNPFERKINQILDKKGNTELINAVRAENYCEIKTLLQCGGLVQMQNYKEEDSIILAIKSNNSRILNLLLDLSLNPIDINKQFTSKQNTYLILAVKKFKTPIVKVLLFHNSDPNINDSCCRTALFYSVLNNDLDTTQALVDENADLNMYDNEKYTVLDIAIKNQNIQLIEYLFLKGAQPSIYKLQQLLFIGCQHNKKEIVNEAVRRGVALNEKDDQQNNLLMICYQFGNLQLLRSLIQKYNLIQVLNEPNNEQETLLLKCLKDGNYRLVKFLLNQKGINLNYQDKQQKTALIIASEEGYYEIIEMLLCLKADPNIADKYGNTPLIIATKNNHILCVSALLEFEFNHSYVNQANKYMSQVRDGKDLLSPLRQDFHGLNARNYALQEKIKKIINYYMIDTDQLSMSLRDEIAEEEEAS